MNLDDLSALDVETEPTVKTENPYALEPWRVKQGLARISCLTSVGMVNTTIINKDLRYGLPCLTELLEALAGSYVICHNSIFDVAWVLVTLQQEMSEEEAYTIVNKIKWLDTLLLSKWVSNHNSKERISHSLINVCNRHIPDHPRMKEFNDVKSQTVTAGEDFEYWLERNKLDTEMTLAVFKSMWSKLHTKQRRGYFVEQACIAPIAKGWVKGIPFDAKFASELHDKIEIKKIQLCKDIGVPVGCLTSPKQKQELIFGKWGIAPGKLTPKGLPSTAHDVLIRIHQKTQDNRLDKLMAAIKLATIQSKYTKGFARTLAYVGVPVLYGSPKLFGTYTGRMTYSNKTTKKQEHQTSIALHQVPRKAKAIKHCMKIPDGYSLLAIDANSQELRWVAEKSRDDKLLQGYQAGLDLHSDMTAAVYGRPYEEVVEGNKKDIKEIVEERQSGKLLNLSCQYRIGAPSLAEKFFTDYEKDIDVATARRYLSMYKRQYPGVVRYWSDAISMARSKGYAETIAGRRCKIEKFDWVGESSAINFPIQGSGSDHTEATIAHLNRLYPFMTLVLQLHDGLYYFCPTDKVIQIAHEIESITKTGIYEQIFQKSLPIKFPFDAGYSHDSFGKITNL